MSAQKPSVSRLVHYVSYGTPIRQDGTQAYTSVCRAAVVTAVEDDETVALFVINPTGTFHNVSELDEGHEAEHDTDLCTGLDHAGGTWHWPARV